MHKKKIWIASCILAAGFTMNMTYAVGAADAEKGELIFAQCEEYINVRSEADENSEVVAKLYNDGAATVEETEDNGWYKITSGNASGYVKAEYFATGEQAQEIADQVAYNVAVVNAEALNIRTAPSEESDVIDVAAQSTELEVVDKSGDWATVALGNDVYGFIHPDYCEYKTYYPTAVTLEEESAREEAMRRAEEAKNRAAEEDAANTDTENADSTGVEDTSYIEDVVAEDSYTEETEASYTEQTPETEPQYTESTPETEPQYTESVPETEPQYTESTPETEPQYTESTPETEPQYTESIPETEYTESTPETQATESTSSDSSLGQQIADYAVQFVGNPYVYGGSSLTNGTDCSGFTMSVMANFGIGLARTAADQAYGGTSISVSDIQPGDLLFYSDGSGISHVALYIGGGQIVHAATESQGIIISNYNYDTPVCAARYW